MGQIVCSLELAYILLYEQSGVFLLEIQPYSKEGKCMNPFQQFARSYMTIGLLAFVLCLSFPGLVLATEGTIDLNTATAKQLEQLPGIGKEIAQRIVNYRTDVGPFTSINELMKVKGIGTGKFAKIKELITIGIATQSPSSN